MIWCRGRLSADAKASTKQLQQGRMDRSPPSDTNGDASEPDPDCVVQQQHRMNYSTSM